MDQKLRLKIDRLGEEFPQLLHLGAGGRGEELRASRPRARFVRRKEARQLPATLRGTVGSVTVPLDAIARFSAIVSS